jgi:hypothetical protein
MADGSRSSPQEDTRPAWVGMLLPSLGDVLFLGLLWALAFTPLSVRLLGDAGIGWHIRTGQAILATRAIPRVDLFSSTMHGAPWFAWEWLYDVLVGGLERVSGLNGVVLFTAVVIAVVFAWTFRVLVRRGTNVFLALALVLLAASASTIHFLARPHVVSWLFTLAWFWILDSSERASSGGRPDDRSAKLLWLLPLLMLVWVNVHGGFLIAFLLLAIYWVAAMWSWLASRESRHRARNLAVVGVLSLGATLVNPFGWGLHVHIYHYLSNRFLMDHIDEFRSPDFHGVAQRCFAILLVAALLALAARGRELRLSEGLVVAFCVYSGLYAARNIPVSSVLIVLVIGPLLQGAGGRLRAAAPTRFLDRMAHIELSQRGHLWPVLAVAASCWIAAHGGRLGSRTMLDAHFDGKRFPVAAVDFLENYHVRGPVLAPDSWGGYLIYRLYPKSLVVLDDRHDLYGVEFLKSYLKLVHAEPGWEDFIHAHAAEYVLAPKDSALANILTVSGKWKAIYVDDVAIAFAPHSIAETGSILPGTVSAWTGEGGARPHRDPSQGF